MTRKQRRKEGNRQIRRILNRSRDNLKIRPPAGDSPLWRRHHPELSRPRRGRVTVAQLISFAIAGTVV